MDSDLETLIALYAALQEAPPESQADHRDAFSSAIKATATARHVDHWRLTAHVVKCWNLRCTGEDKRKGLPPKPQQP